MGKTSLGHSPRGVTFAVVIVTGKPIRVHFKYVNLTMKNLIKKNPQTNRVQ